MRHAAWVLGVIAASASPAWADDACFTPPAEPPAPRFAADKDGALEVCDAVATRSIRTADAAIAHVDLLGNRVVVEIADYAKLHDVATLREIADVGGKEVMVYATLVFQDIKSGKVKKAVRFHKKVPDGAKQALGPWRSGKDVVVTFDAGTTALRITQKGKVAKLPVCDG